MAPSQVSRKLRRQMPTKGTQTLSMFTVSFNTSRYVNAHAKRLGPGRFEALLSGIQFILFIIAEVC